MADRRDLIQSAEKLVARGKLQAAVKEYRKILDRSPSDTNTLNRLGDLYARLDRVDEAVSLFRQIAQHYTRDGFFVKAIAIFKKILRLDPTQFDVYETLAELYHRQGLVSEARAQYEVVADYYRKHGDTAGAIRIHRKMTELEPDRLTHRLKLAELHEAEGEPSDALSQYRRIAELMLEDERVEEAKKVFLRALEVGAEDLGFVTSAVMALRDHGQAAGAEEVLDAAIERNPEAARVRRLTGRAGEAPAETEAPAGAPPPEPTGEVGGDEFEEPLDLAAGVGEAPPLEEEGPAGLVEEEAAPPGSGAPVDLDLELDEPSWFDLDELERSAAEVQPAEGGAAEELLAEAEVFVKYGLDGKAEERLQQVLERRPNSLPAMARLVEVLLRGERHGEVVELAERLARAAGEAGMPEEWEATRRRLLEAGFAVRDGRMSAPGEEPAEEPIEAPAEEGVEPPAEPAEEPQELAEEVAEAGAPAEEEPSAFELDLPVELELVEGVERIGPSGEARAEPEPGEPAEGDEGPAGLDWLGEVQEQGAARPPEAEVFDDEDQFFDLAAELERELEEDGPPAAARPRTGDGEEAGPAREQSLEEIVEGFRKGVEESLSPKDYDTHYNLGIAYREMGLLDEAIGEFQLAAKDPRYLVDCCSMLGLCFLDKGFPELAIKWYRRGLESPAISEEETLGLLYELGNLHATVGDAEAAYETFVEIYGTNSNYRDVVARLEELGDRR